MIAAPILGNLSGIVNGIDAVMRYNNAQKRGYGLYTKGYSLKKIAGRGGRMRPRKYKRTGKRHGRGFATDFISQIPLFGPIIAAPMKALGLGMRKGRRGRGLPPMFLASMNSRMGGRMCKKGSGLLSPAGGTIRRGHYRYIKARGSGMKRVHVHAHRVRHARGGYMPDIW